MNFRAISHKKLVAAVLTSTAADTEIDLSKSFVEPGKREIAATLTAINAVSSDSCTFDYKLQESATTVDSDFADITGATFTQFTDALTAAPETIYFNTKKRYVRGYHTVGSGAIAAAAELLLTLREV